MVFAPEVEISFDNAEGCGVESLVGCGAVMSKDTHMWCATTEPGWA